jgi:hypothetical protein
LFNHFIDFLLRRSLLSINSATHLWSISFTIL